MGKGGEGIDTAAAGLTNFVKLSSVLLCTLGGTISWLAIEDHHYLVEGAIISILGGYCVIGVVPDPPDEEIEKGWFSRMFARTRFIVLALVAWLAGFLFGFGIMEGYGALGGAGIAVFFAACFYAVLWLEDSIIYSEPLLLYN